MCPFALLQKLWIWQSLHPKRFPMVALKSKSFSIDVSASSRVTAHGKFYESFVLYVLYFLLFLVLFILLDRTYTIVPNVSHYGRVKERRLIVSSFFFSCVFCLSDRLMPVKVVTKFLPDCALNGAQMWVKSSKRRFSLFGLVLFQHLRPLKLRSHLW